MKLFLILIIILQLDILLYGQTNYKQHQLWRIENFPERGLLNEENNLRYNFETKFDGLIWKDNVQFMDVSFDRKYSKNAEIFLREFNLTSEILISDLQDLIDHQNKSISNQLPLLSRNNEDLAQINWQSYQDLKTINTFLYTMEKFYPNRVKVFEIGRTAEGRVLKVLRISDDPQIYDRIWVDGGIHAREWITPTAITYIIHTMLINWNILPFHVKTITWLFMPVFNPDGYDYTWKTDRLWYKNRRKNLKGQANIEKCRGVDLNRNFNINWKSTDQNFHPCKENYAGSEEFSESETQCVRDFLNLRRLNLRGYLSFHSYGQLIKYPYSFSKWKTTDVKKLKKGAIKIARSVYELYNSTYKIQAAYKPYPKSGISMDWAKILLNISYTYQVELRDRGKQGFLLPENEIKPTADEALEIVIALSEVIYENDIETV